jgi:hypothetical protein
MKMEYELRHHGIKGMKWGVRRFQNEDGSLTNAGRKRYADDDDTAERRKSVVKKVAIGTAAVAGVVLTAYLVKRHGVKKAAELASKADTGKTAVEKLIESSSVMSTPVSQLRASTSSARPSVETGKRVAEEVSKTISSASRPVSTIQPPPAYDFDSLMKQNDELLKKMYADLLS